MGIDEALWRIRSEAQECPLSLTLEVDGERHCATTPAGGEDRPLPLGCLMKVLTALIAAGCVDRRHFHWHDDAGQIAAAARLRSGANILQGISVKSLLNHTHGLDDAAIERVPLRGDGRIDLARLCEELASVPRLAAPGKVYSYGNAGAWLCAALMEAVTGRSYRELLRAFLEPLLDTGWSREARAEPICAARDETFNLTASELLQIFVPRGLSTGACAAGALTAEPVDFPGWAPSVRGACMGWQWFGAGWFGHNSRMSGALLAVRVNPTLRSGVIFNASTDRPLYSFARLLSPVLPEFERPRVRRLLPTGEQQPQHVERFEGFYVNAASEVLVNRDPTGRLQYQQVRHVSRPREVHATPQRLLAAEGDVFFPAGQMVTELPFLHFVQEEGGRAKYLWNGWSLRQRATPSAYAHDA